MINGLDLFSGIGGISEALDPWVYPVAYCEKDKHAQAVLLSRMARGEIASAPIWDDVQTLRGDAIPAEIDIVYGGFPCTDISVAGPRRGITGEHSSLFYEGLRVAEQCDPDFLFLENVARGIERYEEEIVRAVTRSGFRVLPPIRVSAREVGANHERLRWFLLAYSDRIELREPKRWSRRAHRQGEKINSWPSRWAREPGVPGVAYGVPNRSDRIRALGNAVVPLQAREAFMRLMGIEATP